MRAAPLKRVKVTDPGELGGVEGDLAAFQTMDESGLWLDPLEALLLGGDDAYDSWL